MLNLEGDEDLLHCFVDASAYFGKRDLSSIFLIELLLEIEVSNVCEFYTFGVVHDGEMCLVCGERALVHLELVI